jgi:hypothetical protein
LANRYDQHVLGLRLGRVSTLSGATIEVLFNGTMYHYPVVFSSPVITPLDGPMRKPITVAHGCHPSIDGSERCSEDPRWPLFKPSIEIGGIEFSEGSFFMKHGVFVLFDGGHKYECTFHVRLASIGHGDIAWDDVSDYFKPEDLRYDSEDYADWDEPRRPYAERNKLMGYCDPFDDIEKKVKDWRTPGRPTVAQKKQTRQQAAKRPSAKRQER